MFRGWKKLTPGLNIPEIQLHLVVLVIYLKKKNTMSFIMIRFYNLYELCKVFLWLLATPKERNSCYFRLLGNKFDSFTPAEAGRLF